MMQSIFVDTGAWYAAMVRKDWDHEAAKLFLKNNTSPLITSDYVMDETVTLLLSRVSHSYAVMFLVRQKFTQALKTYDHQVFTTCEEKSKAL